MDTKPNTRIAAWTVAALVFCGAYGLGSWSFNGQQLWYFQSTMHWVALGLLVVFTVGKSISVWAFRALRGLDRWILQNPGRAGLLLVIFMLTYFAFWSGVSFLRHYSFRSSYDLAIMDQVAWNTTQGHLFSRSLEVNNDLGDHVRPFLAMLGVFYLLIPSPYVLLAFQSLVLALTAWPLYRLARRKFDSPAVGLVVALCTLAFSPLGFLNRYDFHIEAMAIPLLIAAYERIDVGDLKSASLFMALTLFTKENLGLNVAVLGIAAGLSYKYWRFGLAWALVGLVYSAIALLVVIPAFRGEASDTLARYQWLGDSPLNALWTILSQPALVLRKFFTAEHVSTVLQLLGPLAFLPLLALTSLLPALPTLIYNFLAEWPAQQTAYQHYMAPVIPFILVSAVVGLHRLSTNAWVVGVLYGNSIGLLRSDQAVGLGVSMLLAATLISLVSNAPIRGKWQIFPQIAAVDTKIQVASAGNKTRAPLFLSNTATIRQGLRNVPPKVSLLTTGSYAPHLSHRSQIDMIPMAPVLTLEPAPDAIFLNLRDLRWWSCDDYFENLQAAAKLNFGVTFYRDDVLLVQKDKGDARKLQDLLGRWPGCK